MNLFHPNFKAAPAFALALVVASGARAQTPEAIAFDRPVRIVGQNGEPVYDAPDGGVFLSPPAYAKVDGELKRLQAVEQQRNVSATTWLVVGMVLGGVTTAASIGAVWAVTR